MLERAGFVGPGEGEFWHGMINQSADAMRDSCIASGRNWIKGPESTFEGEADARFSDKADSKLGGKILLNPNPKAALQKDLFYVSSPFFSQTGGVK
ncbi:hypothetical protein ABOM_002150 [Aspergillus bombycis]|uniref:Uncharacterized protein n=1 Tax=Aspergillus bombycis TaxID=109264 RepID=A0A1F8AAD5_9EURO|nr:hypothetical protein ABOM_002150 [Aspergillus bombycis]OGM48288.1 hypothetical protein ABOM_002150 [Aspergillus bombycis]